MRRRYFGRVAISVDQTDSVTSFPSVLPSGQRWWPCQETFSHFPNKNTTDTIDIVLGDASSALTNFKKRIMVCDNVAKFQIGIRKQEDKRSVHNFGRLLAKFSFIHAELQRFGLSRFLGRPGSAWSSGTKVVTHSLTSLFNQTRVVLQKNPFFQTNSFSQLC